MLPIRSFLKIHPLMKCVMQKQSINVLAASIYNFDKINEIAKSTQYQCVRHYAKGKQKEKARNKGVKFATYKISDEKLTEFVDLEKYRTKLQKSIESMQDDFINQLSLRSTTGSIETIKVKGKGQVYELQDIAQILRRNTKTITINMSSFPELIPATLIALTKSGLNINPQQEGTSVFVPIPKVTREHREGLSKNAKSLFIKYRDQIKNIQNEFLRKVRDNTQITQDDSHAAQSQLTEIANGFIEQAEQIHDKKQKELLNN